MCGTSEGHRGQIHESVYKSGVPRCTRGGKCESAGEGGRGYLGAAQGARGAHAVAQGLHKAEGVERVLARCTQFGFRV